MTSLNETSPAAPGDFKETLADWSQGDVVLEGAPAFLYVADLARPLTPAACELADPPPESGDATGAAVVTRPRGVVVVSQTCDVVRNWSDRPFIEVSVLLNVADMDDLTLETVRTMQRPRNAYVPAVAEFGLVADLDMTMTVEKAVLAQVADKRISGCTTDQERRDFAEALARKRRRAAFPDNFCLAIGKLQDQLKKRHDSDSPQGRLARELREIRVRAAPEWNTQEEVKITFYFIVDGEPKPDVYSEVLKSWMTLFDETKGFRLDQEMPYYLCRLADITAEDYVYSNQLDLDHLSSNTKTP